MFTKLITELEGIGLSDKESKVYLSALELGTSTAQTIAAKATVNRPTTYIAIESLVKKGLMSSITKGKKRFFVAEPPENIFGMLQDQKRTLEEKEGRVSNIMDDLKMLATGSKDRPEVLFFEGENGIERMRENIKKSKSRDIEEFLPLVSEDSSSINFREGKNSRVIYASKEGKTLPEKEKGIEWRPIPADEYPFEGDVVICGTLVNIISYNPKLVGIQIDNEVVASTFRQMFRLAWGNLD